MIRKINSFLLEHCNKKMVNNIWIFLLIAYYFIGLLSYITVPITSFYHLFTASSTLAVVLRGLLCLMLVLYSYIVGVINNVKVKHMWILIFSFVLVCCLFSILISPQMYQIYYIESLYKVVHLITVNPGIPRTIVMFMSSIADFALAFCAMFVLPYVVKDKKKILFLLLPIVFIGLIECAYSFLKEKDIYIFLLNNPDDAYGGYGHEACATFGNKEDWGAFLTVAFISSLSSIYFIESKRKLSKVLKIMLIVSCFIFAGFIFMSLCKTAMLAVFLCLIAIVIGLWILAFKKSIKIGVIFSTIIGGLLLVVVLMFATKGFGISILQKLIDYLTNFILNKVGYAIKERSSIWINYISNMRGYNLFFGLGKAGVPAYGKIIVSEKQSALHNGFAYFFATYGLVGFSVFLILLFIVIKRIFQLSDIKLTPLFLGCFLASLSFIVAESEVIIVSSSNPIFIYNVLVVMLPYGLLLEKRKNYEEI